MLESICRSSSFNRVVNSFTFFGGLGNPPELLRAASELDPSLPQSLEVRGTERAAGGRGQIGVRYRIAGGL